MRTAGLRPVLGIVAAAWLATSGARSAEAQACRAEFRVLSDAVQNTVQVTGVRGDAVRLFAVDRLGVVQALNATTGEPIVSGTAGGVVLDLRTKVRVQGDGGLLSAAFPDDFDASRAFYVYYNRQPDNFNVLSRFRVGPGTLTASLASEEVLLVTPHTIGHNGGWIGFSPTNHFLCLALGDDGTAAAPDPTNKAQTTTGQVFSGKILRLDVSGGDDFPADPNRNYRVPPSNPFVGAARDGEIWSYGVRNPWRCGFDALTGDLWVGNVGQDTWEMVLFQPFNSPGGQNYGWKCMEGVLCTGFGGCVCGDLGFTPPLFAYGHDQGCSISGGAVYRGASIPAMDGLYIYADWCSGRYWTLRQSGGAIAEQAQITDEVRPTDVTPSPAQPVAICNDGVGEVYAVDYSGLIFRLYPKTPAPPPAFGGSFAATPNTLAPGVPMIGTTDWPLCGPRQAGLTRGAGPPIAYGAATRAEPGNEVAYAFTHFGGDVRVSVSTLAGDVDLFVLGPAGTPASTIGFSLSPGTSDESVELPALAPGTYFAVIDTPVETGSGFVIAASFTDSPACPCPADFDASGGTPDTTDVTAFFVAWLAGDPTADADCSGGTPDGNDIDAFFVAWLAGGC